LLGVSKEDINAAKESFVIDYSNPLRARVIARAIENILSYRFIQIDGVWHLFWERETPLEMKREVFCTIRTVYCDATADKIEVRKVMVFEMPDKYELYAEDTAAVYCTFSETDPAPRPETAPCEPQDKAESTKERKERKDKRILSKVCGIANRILRTVSRKEAFIYAWRIAKAGALRLPAAGVAFENRQEALRKLARYDPKDIHAVLVPENNTHDPNAIAVKVMVNGGKGLYKIGYVPKSETEIVRAFIGKVPQIQITGGDIYGARLSLAV
jgi:hypothetical protein